MPDITKDLALAIVKKLKGTPADPQLSRFEVTHIAGSKHEVYKLRYNNVWIGQFGVQRTSKRDARHNYVAEQLHLDRRQGYDLAKCPLSVDAYNRILQELGQIPAPAAG